MARVIIRDRTAIVAWGIALICVLFTPLVCWQILADGQPSDIDLAVVAVFCLVAACFVAFGVSQPIYTVTIVESGEVTFVRQYPFQRNIKVFNSNDIGKPTVSEEIDSDGYSWFTALVSLPNGTDFILSQSGGSMKDSKSALKKKRRCEIICEQFSAAVLAKAETPLTSNNG